MTSLPVVALRFPDGFLWGAATGAHQVEGQNTDADWWDWETRRGATVAEPSGDAIDHVHRYREDIALLASLGLGVYRFGVEWSRVEPEQGMFDDAWLAHYRAMADAVTEHGMVPMVTLNHFTLPRWVAAMGGWLSPEVPALYARYCARVVSRLGPVDWYATINEPGVVAFGGYLGALGFPPGLRSVAAWERASEHLVSAHVLARAAVKEVRPEARVGATHSLSEWEANPAGRPMMELMRSRMEDVFLDACAADDYIGVQTYTRSTVELPAVLAPGAWALARIGWLRRLLLPRVVAWEMRTGGAPRGADLTDMGYEYRPQAVAATVRRVAARFPGKDIVVTEHGIATGDDARRIGFITEGLAALHEVLADGVPLVGYVHWSAFDNFEWAHGYRMRFGLVGVDRVTQERQVKPSARFLGEVARTGALEV